MNFSRVHTFLLLSVFACVIHVSFPFNATSPAKLCDMSKEMMTHFLTCGEMILPQHVSSLLEKKFKRFFKGRDIVDALTDMCVEAWPVINNNVPMTVMQLKDEDKAYSEHVLWVCMNSTRYLMTRGNP